METISDLGEEPKHRNTDVKQLVEEIRMEDNKLHTQPVVLNHSKHITKASLVVFIEYLMIRSVLLQQHSCVST